MRFHWCPSLAHSGYYGCFKLARGAIVSEDGFAMYQCHDVTITPDGVLYAGENDNPHRSGYLWEIRLNGSS